MLSKTPQDTDFLQKRRRIRVVMTIVLLVVLLATVFANIILGQFTVPAGEVFSAFIPGVEHGDSYAVLWNIRMPRIVLGLIVGACLAVSGTLLQALFGNPLADPGIIGVTSGAGVGAAIAVVFSLSFVGSMTIPLMAFISGSLAAVLVYRLAKIGGTVKVVSLILTGIAVNAVTAAAISFLVYLAPTASREQIVFWQMGSLNGARWEQSGTLIIPVVLALIASFVLGRSLDVMSLGERAASHAGINVVRTRILVIGLATVLASLAVSYAGIIGFVGLIVPHILRQVIGVSNQWLLPLSAIGGAILVPLADLVARTVIPFSDLPIGIFTALVGGPVFFILLRRSILKGEHP